MKRKSQKLYASALILLFCISLPAYAEKIKEPCKSGVGVASWYNVTSSSKTTAFSKEFNDRDAQMIANKVCPEGTEVFVTVLKTGATAGPLIVKDRGPYMRGRDWDLPKVVADELGITNEGLADVLVQVVNN